MRSYDLAADLLTPENGTLEWIEGMSLKFVTATFSPYGKYDVNAEIKYCSISKRDFVVFSSSFSKNGH